MTKYCANINENDIFGHKQDKVKKLIKKDVEDGNF